MNKAKAVVNFKNYHTNRNFSIVVLKTLDENAWIDLKNVFH